MSDVIPGLEDSGDLTKLLLAGILSVLVNTGRKWIQDNTTPGIGSKPEE